MNAPLADRPSGSVLFTTESLPPAGLMEAWNAAFGSLNAITVAREDAGRPGTRCENWLLGGGMVLSDTRVSNARFVRDVRRARRDTLDHWVLRVLRRGSGRLQHAGFEAVTGPGDLVLFSMHEPWTAEWDGAEWVSICLPRDLDLRLSVGLSGLKPGVLQGAGAGLLADIMLALPARLAAARPDEVNAIAGVAHSAIAACLVQTPGNAAAPQAPEATGVLARERVRRAILRSLGSTRLNPAELASAAGMSRSALYRMFEEEGGVARYVRRVRLSLAHAALRDPVQANQPVAAIAEAHGFPDPAVFSRAFRAVYGVAPREVRGSRIAGPALPVDRRSGQARPSRDMVAQLYARVSS